MATFSITIPDAQAPRLVQAVAKGDILFKLDQTQFKLALDRADAQIGITRNDLTALQASC